MLVLSLYEKQRTKNNFMAAPITHIVLVEKVFGKLFSDKTKKDFFVGSCFPDIRYSGGIERNKTHFKNLSVVDLKNDNSFLSGLKFHSIVDFTRMDYLFKNNIYSLCPESKYLEYSLKVFEDWVNYPRIGNWQEHIDYLNEILPEETKFGLLEKDLEKWHKSLQEYFTKQPNIQSATDLMLSTNISKEFIDAVNKDVEQMRNNKKMIEAIENFYKNFEDLLT